jgi:hypothetical protein
MTHDEKSVLELDRAIFLLEISLEYIYFYLMSQSIDREEFMEKLSLIIRDILLHIEQRYYFDENNNLIATSRTKKIKTLLLSMVAFEIGEK